MRAILPFFFLFLTHAVFGQDNPPASADDQIYELTDPIVPPIFPGGEQAMMKFILSKIRYPALARENNIQGTVILDFEIDKDGSLRNVRIIRDIGGGCGEESVKVVKSMPKWKPGEANDQPVKVHYTLPIRFRLDDEADNPTLVLRQLDSATVWKGVRIATEQFFDEKEVKPSFKIKNKSKRAALVTALEGQFQVNIGDRDIKSFKRARDLADYIFRAQKGVIFFSKTGFQGKVERYTTDREDCNNHFDCLNFIGSAIVPKGWRLTLFSQPKFKGEQLIIDASRDDVHIVNFTEIEFSETVSTTDKKVNWREEIRSVRLEQQ